MLEKVSYNKVVYGTLVFTAPVLSVWLEALGLRIKIETGSLPHWSLLREERFLKSASIFRLIRGPKASSQTESTGAVNTRVQYTTLL